MKVFKHLNTDIYFEEEIDGGNPPFPINGICVTISDFEKFKNILGMAGTMDNVSVYSNFLILKEKVLNKYQLNKYFKNFNFKKEIGMFIFDYKDDIPEDSKLSLFSETARSKFGVNDIYITYLNKGLGGTESEDSLSLELSIINPKKIMVFKKEIDVDEWAKSHLSFFDVSYK